MIRLAKYILLCVTLCYAMTSCDVHHWPENPIPSVDVNLKLTFDTELPLLAIIERMSTTEASNRPEDYCVRYQVRAYPIASNGSVSPIPVAEWLFTNPDLSNLELTTSILMPPGNFRLCAWVDYVDKNTTEDKFYNTTQFTGVSLVEGPHIGNNDFRDAFIGSTDIYIEPQFELDLPDENAHIHCGRPLAKFSFISTDLEDFVSRVLEARAKQAELEGITLPESELLPSSVDLTKYRIIISYAGFMPSEFNIFTDMPVDSRTNVSFESTIAAISATEALVGFDYVFVNGHESKVLISISVYDEKNKLLSAVTNMEVPVQRSKLTIIRSRFLTESAEGGVGIEPGFDGEFNITVGY